MICELPPLVRLTTRLSCLCGFEGSQSVFTQSPRGAAIEKKRFCLDSGESQLKKAISASRSWDWAMRMVAVEPSRKMIRPDAAES
jgi:hypothetical protein